jgi:Flp pilus assembly protein TadD
MWRFSALLLLFAAVTAQAQFTANSHNETLCTLRVDVEFANKGIPASGVRVQLRQGLITGVPYQVGLTTSSGWAEFENLVPGDYSVEVSGEGIETTDSGNIHIESGRVFLSQLVVVRPVASAATDAAAGAGSSVNVRDLKIPKQAVEELSRGDSEMQHNHWKKAAGHFKKAVSIYPQYSSAYYNLSVAYYRMRQPGQQRDALEKALKIDDHFAPALVSLAHLEFADHKLARTRELLDKATTADPTNVDALALLVRVDFLEGRYQQTIDDANRVHSLPHQGYATVHYTAAAAYQRLNRIPEMIAELKTYLKEDPNSPSAAYVRQTIAAVENQPH